jgi:hypothetical protein
LGDHGHQPLVVPLDFVEPIHKGVILKQGPHGSPDH